MKWNTTVLELIELFRAKQVTPREAVDFYLARIDRLNDEFNAFLFRRDNEVRLEADDITQRMVDGETLSPFAGIPLPVKSLTAVKGWPYDVSCAALEGNKAVIDHGFVTALRDSGFLFLGQTNSPEMGCIPVTESALNGVTPNPWDTTRTAGGSSGGSAVAVALGLAPAATASDGGGSIRIPAACCGLVGLKPSRGRLPVGPMSTFSLFSTPGFVTRDVRDTALLLDSAVRYDAESWVQCPPEAETFVSQCHEPCEKLRIGVALEAPLGTQISDESTAVTEKIAKLCSEQGHEVVEAKIEWGDRDQIREDFMRSWSTISFELKDAPLDKFEPHNRYLREQAMSTNALDYQASLSRLQIFSRRVTSSFRDFDVLLTPLLAHDPPKTGEMTAGFETDPAAVIDRAFTFTPFTCWFNVTGQPALALPVELSKAGMPLSVHLVGKPWAEHQLIRLGAQLEEAIGWNLTPPGVS